MDRWIVQEWPWFSISRRPDRRVLVAETRQSRCIARTVLGKAPDAGRRGRSDLLEMCGDVHGSTGQERKVVIHGLRLLAYHKAELAATRAMAWRNAPMQLPDLLAHEQSLHHPDGLTRWGQDRSFRAGGRARSQNAGPGWNKMRVSRLPSRRSALVCCLLSAVCCLLSAVCEAPCPISAVRPRFLATNWLQSTKQSPLGAYYASSPLFLEDHLLTHCLPVRPLQRPAPLLLCLSPRMN